MLIRTTFDRDDYVFDGLQAGASGFLLKNAGPEQLVDALRAVAEGHALPRARGDPPRHRGQGVTWIPGPRPAARLASRRPRRASPTANARSSRSWRAARPTARSLRNFFGEATVKTHVSNTLGQAAPARPGPGVVFAYENGLTLS